VSVGVALVVGAEILPAASVPDADCEADFVLMRDVVAVDGSDALLSEGEHPASTTSSTIDSNNPERADSQ